MNKKKSLRSNGEDWIHLCGVETQCVLGAYPSERAKSRPVRLSVSLQCDLQHAAQTDRLADTLNYELIEAEIVAVAKKGQFHLVEALAEQVAAVCLAHSGIHAVRVVVEKPGALPLTQKVSVEIVRRK